MKLWTADTGRFWLKAGLALLVLLLIGSVCHVSIHPPRLYLSDLLIFIPLAICALVSVKAGVRVDILTRAAFGVLQAIVLLAIYENLWDSDIRYGRGSTAGLLFLWVIVCTTYAGAFAAVTQVVSEGFDEIQDKPDPDNPDDNPRA